MASAKIAIRIDDVCPYVDQGKLDYAIRKVESCGVMGLLGIVPDCKDTDLLQQKPDVAFWDKMRLLQNRGWLIALHGLNHVYITNVRGLVNARSVSEFAGNPYEVQRNMLAEGKRLLEEQGLATDIFFAPAHSYDLTTLDALRDLGFKYVSDGLTRKCYMRRGLKHIPCRHYGLPKNPKGIETLAMHPCEPKPFEPWVDYIEGHKIQLVSFSDILEEPCGLASVQIASEWACKTWRRSVKPPLKAVRDFVLRRDCGEQR